MKNILLVIMVLIMPNNILASGNAQISNLVAPVSYFVNHIKQLSDIKHNLTKYGKTSVIGTSGIGKTQLARTYAYENRGKYNLIWFFDCNLDISGEFVKLAKQLNKIEKSHISLDIMLAKKEVIEYLTNKEGWLLVFDNLKIGDNKKIRDIVDWENNGNIVLCSQEAEGLPSIVEITKFNKNDAIDLANNILQNQNFESATFLAESFKGYPMLIVQGAQLLNQVKGLDKEEYKKKIFLSADKIKANIILAIEELSPSAQELLSKISMINNQSFSKHVLSIITDNKESLNDDIYQLSKFALISSTNNDDINPIFEMHDVIAQKIQEINGDEKSVRYLEEVVTKFISFIPRGVVKAQVFREGKTVCENLQVITQNAQKRMINLYIHTELNLQLMIQYVNASNLHNAKILVDWFDKNEKEGKYKLWMMNNNEKGLYARYLGMIGWYYRRYFNYRKAYDYYIKELKIYKNVKGFESSKCNAYFGSALTNISLGQVQEAEKNVHNMAQMFDQNLVDRSDIATLVSAQGVLCYIRGQYEKSLEHIDILKLFSYILKRH